MDDNDLQPLVPESVRPHSSARASHNYPSSMQTLLFLALLFLQLLPYAHAQAYCQCGAGFVNDPLQQCFTSPNYDVQNACFVCPVQNATAKYYYCNSLYALGFAVCGQSGAVAAMKTACAAIGGDTSSPDFRCFDNTGFNQSQVQACTGVTASPTAPVAPTSNATRVGTPYAVVVIVGLVLFLVVTA